MLAARLASRNGVNNFDSQTSQYRQDIDLHWAACTDYRRSNLLTAILWSHAEVTCLSFEYFQGFQRLRTSSSSVQSDGSASESEVVHHESNKAPAGGAHEEEVRLSLASEPNRYVHW